MRNVTKKYFVYVLIRPDGRVFYIGKGTIRKSRNTRLTEHLYEAKRGHLCYKCRIIRKLISEGQDITCAIVFETDLESDAFDHERDLISLYGRGNLTNLTDGGEGMAGYSPTASTRLKIGQACKGKIFTPERRLKISQALTGIKRSPETRAKMRGNKNNRNTPRPYLKGIPKSEAHKKALRLAAQQRTISPETRAKMALGISKSLKGVSKSAAHRESMRRAAKIRGISQKTRIKMALSKTGSKHSAETRMKMRLSHLGKNKKPTVVPNQMSLGL